MTISLPFSLLIPVNTSDIFNINKTHVSEEVNFSQQAIFEALDRAKRITSGPDSIPSIFWVNIACVQAFPISTIFQFFIETAI